MKSSPLQEKFEKIRADYTDARETKLLALTLGALQSVVKELQESGMPAALVVRAASEGMESVPNLPIIANGRVTLGDLETPFIVAKPESGTVEYLHLHFTLGQARRTVFVREGNNELQGQIATALLRIRAEKEFAESFNVGTTGISKMVLDKFPSPKLPKP